MKKRSLAFVFAMALVCSTLGSTALDAGIEASGIVYHADGIYEFPAENDPTYDESDLDALIAESYNAALNAGTIIYYPSGIYEYPSKEELEFDPSQAIPGISDIIVTRGDQAPTDEYNINGKDYHVSGTFVNYIYTSYYFSPTAKGNLRYNFVVGWDDISERQRSAEIYLVDRNTGKEQKLRTISTVQIESSSYYTSSATSEVRILGGLDPDHDYYFRIAKYDGETAELTGTIGT